MPRRGSVGGTVGPISGLSRLSFNAATGGSVATVSNYNGTGQTWKVHSFTSNSSLVVTQASELFKIFVLGGGPGGCGLYAGNGGNSGGGLYYYSDTETLPVATLPVVIGGAGGGYGSDGPAADSGNGSSGGSSTFSGRTGAGGVHHTYNGTHPFTTDITGTSLSYSYNTSGTAGYNANPTIRGSAGNKSGIHPTGGPNFGSGPGVGGYVVVAYRVE